MSADVRYVRDAEGGYDVRDRTTNRWLGCVIRDTEAREWYAWGRDGEGYPIPGDFRLVGASYVGTARTRREATDLILNGGAS